MNATVELLDQFAHCVATLTRAVYYGDDTSKHILDAVIELGDQQALVLLRFLCGGHIADEGRSATLVASIKSNAREAKHQNCKTSQSNRHRHHIGRQS